MNKLPLGFGQFDWADWVRGLVVAFTSGGCAGVAAAAVLKWSDPESYLYNPMATLKLMLGVFVVTGLFGFFAYLAKHSWPDKIVERSTTVTEVAGKPAVIESTVKEITQEPVVPPTTDVKG